MMRKKALPAAATLDADAMSEARSLPCLIHCLLAIARLLPSHQLIFSRSSSVYEKRVPA